ncbi:MAG: CehA/McbA family metallohydrolase [Myxococcota bacterium]
MSRPCFLILLSIALLPGLGRAQLVVEQVTVANAATRLFGGSDADGGIDDWYLSNGIVEAIIDDVGVQSVPLGVVPPPKQNEAAPTGGTILDLGLVGMDNDQLAQVFTVGGLSTENFILYDSISASTALGEAKISVSGVLLGFDPLLPSELPVVTEYIVTGTDPFVTIRTTVTNLGSVSAGSLGGFLDVFLWISRAIVPFSPLPGKGFTHTELDLENPAGLIAAIEFPTFMAGPGNLSPADGVMDPTSGKPAGQVAYGLLGSEISIDQDGPGGSPPVVTPVNSLFGVSSHLISGLGNNPFATGLGLDPGGTLVYERRIYVGARNDVAAVANPMITELAARQGFATGTISGDVEASDTPDVAVSMIATRTGGPTVPGFDTGAPVNHFRTDVTGAFSGVVLPEGTYDLEFRSVERDPVTVSGVVVTAGADTPVSVPPLSGLGTLELIVQERRRGPDPMVPARITFKGLDGTPDPLFKKDFEAFEQTPTGLNDIQPEVFAGGPAQRNFVYLADGTIKIQVRPGKYELFATRGPEYTVARSRVTVREGRTRRRRLRVRRIVETPGYLSGDFHIHSARSFDSSAAVRDRVVSFAAEGVEVMISTDHDYQTDYAPVITSLGLESWISSIVGNEITTSVPNPPAFPDSLGHINAWPQTHVPDARRNGAIEDEYVAPNLIFSRARGQGAEVVQYNHVRAGVSGITSIGFFNNFGYDPNLPITTPPNDLLLDDDVTGTSSVSNPDGFRNIDFDVMEIINGTNVGRFLEVRRDWFSLLNQMNAPTPAGPVPFIGGTAVSDSHRLTSDSPGYARSYVAGVGDDPSTVDVSAFNANIRAGRLIGTTGPFVEFAIRDASGSRAELGETLVPSSSSLVLEIRVQATNWIPVEEVRVIRNGFVEPTLVFDAASIPSVRDAPSKPWTQSRSRVVRFDAELPVNVSEDSYFVVEAGIKLDPPSPTPDFVNTVVPSAEPLAFTNPIFVDLAGDGFDPPGLPVLPASVASVQRIARGAQVPSLGDLDPEKREEVLAHWPVHKIRISEEGARQLHESHSR